MTTRAVNSEELDFPTSSNLLVQAKAHDQQAWHRLVSLYGPLIYRWCRQTGLQPADAADASQEVFLAVARKLGDFRHSQPGDTFRGWLRTITRNKIRDYARVKMIRLRDTRWLDSEGLLHEPGGHAAGDEETACEARLVLWRAVELIRGECEPLTWQAFWLVSVETRPPADVAADLRMSLNAVYLAKSEL